MNKTSKPTTKPQGKKEYAPSFGFWSARSGKGFTVGITQQLLDTLAKAEIGGRLLLLPVPEDVRAENDKLPVYRVTIYPADKKQDEEASI